MAFRDWAIPERIHQDNGADFCSQVLTGMTKATRDSLRRQHGRDWHKVLKRDANLVECVDPRFTGIIEELGIDIVYARKMQPWGKGVCERWFGTFEGRCGKTFVTYCDNSSLSRPECLQEIRRGYTKAEKRALRSQYGREWKRHAVLKLMDKSDVPTLDYARTAVAEFIDEYHHRPHSAEDMGGRTPLEVWQSAARIRRAGEDELLLLMQTRGVYRVGPNGVTFKFAGKRDTYGQGNTCLYKYTGRDVLVTIDPNKPECCYAFTADRDNRRFIGKLDRNERLSPMATAEELREAHAAVERRRKVMRKAQREASAQTRTAAQELAAKRRKRVAELRATGTDDRTARPTIVPVRTGFEGATQEARADKARPVRRDLAEAAKALSYGHGLPQSKETDRPRATLDMLGPAPAVETDSPEDDGDGIRARMPRNHGRTLGGCRGLGGGTRRR